MLHKACRFCLLSIWFIGTLAWSKSTLRGLFFNRPMLRICGDRYKKQSTTTRELMRLYPREPATSFAEHISMKTLHLVIFGCNSKTNSECLRTIYVTICVNFYTVKFWSVNLKLGRILSVRRVIPRLGILLWDRRWSSWLSTAFPGFLRSCILILGKCLFKINLKIIIRTTFCYKYISKFSPSTILHTFRPPAK